MSVSDQERKRRGRAAEEYVCQQLARCGYKIIARNFAALPYGEIDIIASKDGVLTMIEVKARKITSNFGGPLAAINTRKMNKMQNCLNIYLKQNQIMNSEIAILAAAVYHNNYGEIIKSEIIPIEIL
jgi:putative endonuclease